MEEEEQEKRYALLLACQDSEYVKKVYGGYFNVFVRAFGAEGERWDLFRVVDGDFPASDELEKYDGFVVSGSPHDAYADDLWILRLCYLLQTLDAMHKRVLGVCFGHQVLCRARGGRIGRAYQGWDVGIREVTIVGDSLRRRYLGEAEEIPPSPSIIECHQDEVWDMPLDAQVVAFSEKTGVEIFAVGEHILGIQGHPEYTKDILYHLIDRLVESNTIQMTFAEDVRSKLEAHDPDNKFWEKICKSFLKGR